MTLREYIKQLNNLETHLGKTHVIVAFEVSIDEVLKDAVDKEEIADIVMRDDSIMQKIRDSIKTVGNSLSKR